MAVSDDGKKVYVGTRVIGRVYEVTDDGDKRTVRVVVDKLTQPAGVAFNKGSLYVFAIDKVLRFDGIAEQPERAAAVDLTAKFDLPKEQHHNWKYVAFGPDGKLYVPFGAPCNICEPPTQGIRADPALQRRRLGQGSHRHRRAQLGRLRLASEDQGALVHRPRPRLGGRQGLRGRAEPRDQGRRRTSASRTATPTASRTRT